LSWKTRETSRARLVEPHCGQVGVADAAAEKVWNNRLTRRRQSAQRYS
jgi:hypothetical protein